MTPFRFEHEFRAPSVAVIFEAYFDAALQAQQDLASKIRAREVIEREETADHRIVVTKVFPERQLPAVVRPLVSGPLHYVERTVWDKHADRMDLDIRPSLLGKRTQIRVAYTVAQIAPGRVLRVCEGDATVEVALIGGRVERSIIEDMAETLPRVAACTQAWLDARSGL
ncbi:MAG: DUF2505 domain-containing protein [Deltaproteobacteria bacterium]|nr:DUF2505 domain-containing protein [Deltaproteobacteria bacterium]